MVLEAFDLRASFFTFFKEFLLNGGLLKFTIPVRLDYFC